MAFHYADIHYFEDPQAAGEKDLDFPGRGDPGPWDFLCCAHLPTFLVEETRYAGQAAVRAEHCHVGAARHRIGARRAECP